MDKKSWVTIAVVVAALAAVGIGYWMYQVNTQADIQNNQLGSETAEEQNNGNGNDSTSNEPVVKLAYTAAVELYGDRRIQFDETCVALPNYMALKKGTAIMLDNRASVARKISVGGVAYNIAAYDYQVITLSTGAPLPITLNVDCGTGQQNARILLQQ